MMKYIIFILFIASQACGQVSSGFTLNSGLPYGWLYLDSSESGVVLIDTATYYPGDLIFAPDTNKFARFAGNSTTTRLYLSSIGNGTHPDSLSWQSVPMPTYVHSQTYTAFGTLMASSGMLGLAISITPSASGTVVVNVTGSSVHSDTTGYSVQYEIRYGTGTAPLISAAAAGTLAAHGTLDSNISGTSRAPSIPFAANATITGLSVGTTYWFDLYISEGEATTPADITVIINEEP